MELALSKRRESLPSPRHKRGITSFGNTKRFEEPKLYQHQINEQPFDIERYLED
jgi:hypothetical protein